MNQLEIDKIDAPGHGLTNVGERLLASAVGWFRMLPKKNLWEECRADKHRAPNRLNPKISTRVPYPHMAVGSCQQPRGTSRVQEPIAKE